MDPLSPQEELKIYTDDEINIVDIFVFFKDGWRWIVSSALVCLLIGTAYAYLQSPKYKATANIQMATVAGKSVESHYILNEKLKLPLYYSTETIKACDLDTSPSPGESLAAILEPKINKSAPIVVISFQSTSVNGAKRCIEAVLGDIRTKQNIIAKPIIESKKSLLETLQQKLEAAERIKNQLPIKIPNFNFSDPNFSASALLLSTIMSKEIETKDLTNQINDLRLSLADPQTQETSLATPIYASNIEVGPKRSLVILIFTLFGGFAAILFLTLRKAWQKGKLQSSK